MLTTPLSGRPIQAETSNIVSKLVFYVLGSSFESMAIFREKAHIGVEQHGQLTFVSSPQVSESVIIVR